MRFWRSPLGAFAVIVLLSAGAVLGATAVQVHRQMAPPRVEEEPLDFEAMDLPVEEVTFPSSDGIRLSGAFYRGRADAPPVVLCHDLGASSASLTNLAIALQSAGFPVLAFDFRGHGRSGGARSTLGLLEKRDVVGAVEYLGSVDALFPRRIGVYGVGMGAHAAVLAAAERPAIKVLVLDGLYPDAAYPLVRGVFGGWHFGASHMAFLVRGAFFAFSGRTPGSERAEDVIGTLLGRDMLLLAPAGDESLVAAMMRMYEAVPEQADADPNLVVLPATQSEGLFAEQSSSYRERVTDFFTSRLER